MHVLAFDDTVKLPSDTIQPEGAEQTSADDMHALGALIHQMLTRDLPREDAETDYSFLPRPFGAIVNHTLARDPAKRWTTRDIETHLNPPPPKIAPLVTERPPTPTLAPTPPAAVEALERTIAAEAVVEKPMMDEERPNHPVIELPPPHRRSDPPADRGLPLKWVPVAGLAAAAALGAVLLRHPDNGSGVEKATPAVTAPAPAPKATPPAPTPRPTIPEEPKPSPTGKQSRDRMVTAEAKAPTRTKAPVSAVDDPRPSTGSPIWRVVAFTYNRREQAEHKAKALNEKHSSWRAEVFSPKGDRAPYFVSLGGRMTLTEAEQVQKDARSKGLPKDTFVRNFSK
jgi:hypothetical protein